MDLVITTFSLLLKADFRRVQSDSSPTVKAKGGLSVKNTVIPDSNIFGDAELIRPGWECGFGEANSKRFGMVEAAARR